MTTTKPVQTLLNGHGPWWAKLVGVIGVPGVALGFLVWFLTQTFAVELASHAEDTSDRLDTLIRVFTAVCVNTAGDSEERSRCFSLNGPQR